MGLGAVKLPPKVPQRRLVDLARYGMGATATTLRRHGPSRQLATLLATVVYLEGKSVDDRLDLLDLLMTTELIGKAETATSKERARQHPKLARHSATLAAAVEITEYGEEISLEQVWESIDAIVPRRELKTAVAAVTEMVPPPEADYDGPPTPHSSTPRPTSASPGSSAAAWSPRSTGCGSWCRSLRVAVSIYTGQVRAHDVMKMLQRDGNPTQLGEAIAHYGRIFKTLRILTYAVEEPYRRDIKGVRNCKNSGTPCSFLSRR